VIATFEDPNCGFCKQLAKDLRNVNDITVYTFLYPIMSPDSMEKSKAVWCAEDRSKAWNDLMIVSVQPIHL
jgi:thiol:disulfide interchange protein DsbC